MSSSEVDPGARVQTAEVSATTLTIHLDDGRVLSVPLEWYPRLRDATPAQRENWRIAGAGFGIHWPDLDEDLSVDGLLRGARAPGSSSKSPRA